MNESDKKGQIAFLKASTRLTEMGYAVFVPLGEPKDAVDLIATKESKCIRFQVKYLGGKTKMVPRGNGNASYKMDDFDYFAVYIPELDVVCFPSIEYKMCTLRICPSGNYSPFYWYADFLDLTDTAAKRTNVDIGAPTAHKDRVLKQLGPRPNRYVQTRPSKEVLEKLIWSMPTTDVAKQFNMSDNGITRWIKDYGLDKPPRGYWQKKQAAGR